MFNHDSQCMNVGWASRFLNVINDPLLMVHA